MNMKKRLLNATTDDDYRQIFLKTEDYEELIDYMIESEATIPESIIYKFIPKLLDCDYSIVEIQKLCRQTLSNDFLLKLFSLLVKDSYDLKYCLAEYAIDNDFEKVLQANSEIVIKILCDEPYDFIEKDFSDTYNKPIEYYDPNDDDDDDDDEDDEDDEDEDEVNDED